jgi:hypothetical protein
MTKNDDELQEQTTEGEELCQEETSDRPKRAPTEREMLALKLRQEVLRLSGEGLGGNAIGRKLGTSGPWACEIIRRHGPVDPEKLRQRSETRERTDLERLARQRMTEIPQRLASKSSDRPYSVHITGPDGFTLNYEHLSGEEASRVWEKLAGGA